MKAKEINQRLQNGEKLIYKNNAYCNDLYFIGNEDVKNRINKNQFDRAKEFCNKSDDSDKHTVWFRGQSYREYYWIEEQNV